MIKKPIAKILALFALLVPVIAVAAPAHANDNRPVVDATFRAEFTNITSGQYLTPPNFAAHGRNLDVFSRNQPASPGVRAVAENGGVPILAEELAAAVASRGGVSGVGHDAPIAPGETVTFEFSTDQARFSLVSMIICTNDGFVGVDGRFLPQKDGRTRTYRVNDYDAGTEVNTENRADIVPAPFCGADGGTGESNPALAENGVIKRHRTLRGVGDLPSSFDWTRGQVAELTITRVASDTDADPGDLVGLSLDNATAAAASQGLTLRVVVLDGVLQPVTRDLVPNRVNVEVSNGTVVAVRGLG